MTSFQRLIFTLVLVVALTPFKVMCAPPGYISPIYPAPSAGAGTGTEFGILIDFLKDLRNLLDGLASKIESHHSTATPASNGEGPVSMASRFSGSESNDQEVSYHNQAPTVEIQPSRKVGSDGVSVSVTNQGSNSQPQYFASVGEDTYTGKMSPSSFQQRLGNLFGPMKGNYASSYMYQDSTGKTYKRVATPQGVYETSTPGRT